MTGNYFSSYSLFDENQVIMAAKRKKTRYNQKELAEFEKIIDQKLEQSKEQLEYYLTQIKESAENADAKQKGLDDGTNTQEKQRLYTMAARQRKHIQHLENALLRIKNKVYGVCRVSGELISKERLKAVPHATLSIEAKQSKFVRR